MEQLKNMNKSFFFIIFLAIAIQNCFGQATPEREIYNPEFKWTITIPENFENVEAAEWMKMQDRGAAAIEETIDAEVINEAKTIFVFRSDRINYFESNYQPFDTAVDGDYLESCRSVNEVLYQTFKDQMPGARIDSTAAAEKIDNLEFQTYQIKIELPNNFIINAIMFSRLFGKKEFSVNILYADPIKGEQMLNAWRNSKFAR